jgi:hypothetical protein
MRYAVIVKFSMEGSEWFVGKSSTVSRYADRPHFITERVRFAPRFWTKAGADEYLAEVKKSLLLTRQDFDVRVKKLWWL